MSLSEQRVLLAKFLALHCVTLEDGTLEALTAMIHVKMELARKQGFDHGYESGWKNRAASPFTGIGKDELD